MMRPWSAEELIMANQLQPIRSKSKFLIEFHEKYGGCARDAYRLEADSDSMNSFDHKIRLKAKKLPRNIFESEYDIEAETNKFLGIDGVSDEASHNILSIFPNDDDDRTKFDVKCPTTYILDIVFAALSNSSTMAILDLFNGFVGSRHSGENAFAGYYYGNHFHESLVRRSCSCYLMGPPHRQRTSNQAKRHWSTIDTQVYTFSILRRGEDRVPTLYYTRRLAVLKEHTYYIPTSKVFPTFDSFYVKTSTHVVVFQSSVAKEHEVSEQGFRWLAQRGIRTVEYAYVSPSCVPKARLPFPAAVPDSLQYSNLNRYPPTVITAPHTATDPTAAASFGTLELGLVKIYHLLLDLTL
ncbi:hypothetical protein F5050DRAFT_1202295 [Lentinula boryana]|uniref:Uncharacterized protein n=1 Tax=Lentinula boryana TaxID=40481 RepID=A0ABQ8QJ94_9AGAR|nr:hypothetical protein F5050DRAFT_1202295 [Lentinula boryana]